MLSRTLLLLSLTLVLSACRSPINPSHPAPPAPSMSAFSSPLSNLAAPHSGRAMHESSWDRGGGNADMRRLEPGQTREIFNYSGAGVVHRFWVTIAPRSDMKLHRQTIIRMYWDDEKEPSVEAPIGDFFGVGFGEQRDYISLPLNETSGGYNCYWPMPFHKSARWTVTNMSDKAMDAFYYNIDFTAHDSLPPDTRHFHAQWRRENPTTNGKNYTILETTGAGHYVGVALFMQAIQPRGLGFLEGDEMITIDDHAYQSPDVDQKSPGGKLFASPTTRPQIIGTGSEDYFSSGWYYDRGLYSAPYHGIQIKDDPPGRVNTYRWHIEDAMPFTKNIKVTIEHGHGRHPNDHKADYSSIAFYYQTEPHTPAPPITDAAALLPTKPPQVVHFPGVTEAESLAGSAKASAGNAQPQSMQGFNGQWSGDAQLFWTDAGESQTLEIPITAPKTGDYQITAFMTRAPDYGTVQLSVGGAPLGKPVNLYSQRVEPSGATRLGTAHLNAGQTTLTIRITGKDEASTNTFVGIDGIKLEPAQAKATAPATQR
ncbi:MAG TPA: glycoside hydrolase family 172 protein [Tepidisphaeraceae bacterium]|jgi:hypothetical protein